MVKAATAKHITRTQSRRCGVAWSTAACASALPAADRPLSSVRQGVPFKSPAEERDMRARWPAWQGAMGVLNAARQVPARCEPGAGTAPAPVRYRIDPSTIRSRTQHSGPPPTRRVGVTAPASTTIPRWQVLIRGDRGRGHAGLAIGERPLRLRYLREKVDYSLRGRRRYQMSLTCDGGRDPVGCRAARFCVGRLWTVDTVVVAVVRGGQVACRLDRGHTVMISGEVYCVFDDLVVPRTSGDCTNWADRHLASDVILRLLSRGRGRSGYGPLLPAGFRLMIGFGVRRPVGRAVQEVAARHGSKDCRVHLTVRAVRIKKLLRYPHVGGELPAVDS